MVRSISHPLQFHCRQKIGRKCEEWDGYIKALHNYGSHYEIHVESRSGFIFMVGKYINGGFISIPCFGVGTDIAYYNDYFWNYELLSILLNPVDAATVAEALRVLNINKYI